MDTALTETQSLLQSSMREYLRREVSFDRARQLEQDGGYDHELWGYLQSAGYLALPFPTDLGGDGGSLLDFAVLVEELTRRAVVIPFVETLTSAITLARFASPEQFRGIIRGVIEGRILISPAIAETSDLYTQPSVSFDGTNVSGTKCFVDYGQVVTHHLVSAVERGATVLALVDANAPGVSCQPLRGISRLPQANVTYESVPGTRVAGEDALGFLLRLNQAISGVQCLGNAQQALEMTVDYVARRVQFGRPIGTFQAVQHHCANMATMVEACRFLAYEALWMLANGEPDDRQLAVAKNWASRTVTEVTTLAHQLHGGVGVTEVYDLHFFTRRGKDRAVAWGSFDETLRYLSETIEEPNQWR